MIIRTSDILGDDIEVAIKVINNILFEQFAVCRELGNFSKTTNKLLFSSIRLI